MMNSSLTTMLQFYLSSRIYAQTNLKNEAQRVSEHYRQIIVAKQVSLYFLLTDTLNGRRNSLDNNTSRKPFKRQLEKQMPRNAPSMVRGAASQTGRSKKTGSCLHCCKQCKLKSIDRIILLKHGLLGMWCDWRMDLSNNMQLQQLSGQMGQDPVLTKHE